MLMTDGFDVAAVTGIQERENIAVTVVKAIQRLDVGAFQSFRMLPGFFYVS